MMRHLAFLYSLSLLALCAEPACGQATHDHDLTVYVPPAMSIVALRPDQFVAHPYTAADITMTDSRWWASTTSSTGSTVQFSTQTVFENQDKPGYKRDVRLQSPLLFGSPGAGWGFDTPVDQSDHAAGDETAMVQVSGTGPGIALIFLQVTFITGDLATLAGGDYEVTVTGTITAN